MVRVYNRVTNRGSYGDAVIQDALNSLAEGSSLNKVSNEFGIPRRTLRRHRDGKVSQPGSVKLGRYVTTLWQEFELELVSHIQYMERHLFGLQVSDICRLAFDLAERQGTPHPFNKAKGRAGRDWFNGFRKRHPELTIRKPEATSLSRAVGFNAAKVNQFFSVYEELVNGLEPSATNIWNMDESGITNVHCPNKIVATTGVKQVSKITSGEKGKTVTIVCTVSASGGYVPPMMIFPRKGMINQLMKGAPVGATGVCSPKGWIDGDLFLEWLNHFIKNVRPSKEDPHILILDGHHSHKTLQAVTLARANGIHMITLPPHCTHKMQPLDRTFFKSLKNNYNDACDKWMLQHPGRRITFFEMSEIFGNAYNKSASVDKAVNGFKVCGLWPVNSDIFSAEDFAGAEVTDEPQPVQPAVQPVQHAVQLVQPAVQPVLPAIQPVQPAVQPVQHAVKPVQPAVQSQVQPAVQPVQPAIQSQVQPAVQLMQPAVQPQVPQVDGPQVEPTNRQQVQPEVQPAIQPQVQPAIQPWVQPLIQAQVQPAIQPQVQPAIQPWVQPSIQPQVQNANQPQVQPSTHPQAQNANQPQVHSQIQPHPGLEEARKILAEISPLPKLAKPRPRKRKAESAAVLTSSPYMNSLQKIVNEGKKRQSESSKKNIKASKSTSKKNACKSKATKSVSKKNTTKSNTTKSKDKNTRQSRSGKENTKENDETPCRMCGHKYSEPPYEDWQQCPTCQHWFHLSCVPDDTNICYFCLD